MNMHKVGIEPKALKAKCDYDFRLPYVQKCGEIWAARQSLMEMGLVFFIIHIWELGPNENAFR
jgi:hypothetical protein